MKQYEETLTNRFDQETMKWVAKGDVPPAIRIDVQWCAEINSWLVTAGITETEEMPCFARLSASTPNDALCMAPVAVSEVIVELLKRRQEAL